MSFCKLPLRLPMLCTKKWLLLLHNCLHPCLLQVPPYSFRGQGLIESVFEHLGALGRILNLPSFHEMHDMMETGEKNIGRATTRRLGDVRTVFPVNLGDESNRDAKVGGDIMARMTRFKQLDDRVNFGSRETLHG